MSEDDIMWGFGDSKPKGSDSEDGNNASSSEDQAGNRIINLTGF